jgi:2-methylcitrate dehydratase PrpD
MDRPSLSRQFSRWAATLRYEDLSPAVVDKTRALLLHALAGAMLGAAKPQAAEVLRMVLKEEGKPDGASILCHGGKATRVGAAYANAELIHLSLMFDSYRMLTHPGPVLIPAALANAELEGRNGRELITALAAGYEFMFRLCDEFIPATAARGFRPSPIYCTLGAALASGKLMGLDEDGLVSTIALAANFAAGLNEGPRSGGNENSIHEPQAARNGVFAALIAREGHVKGAELTLEGDAGFFNAFTGNNRGELSYSFREGVTRADMFATAEGLGREWKLLTAMFRMYPMAGYNQPVVDLVAEMKAQHGLDAGDMADVSVKMNWIETLYPSPAFPRSADWNKPSFVSTHYFAAHAAVNGGYPVVGGRTYGPTGDKLREDQRVLDFMNHHVNLVPEKGRAMFSPGAVITLKDGRRFEGEYPYERMEWNFDQLAAQLQRCLPGFPGGKPALDGLVAAVRATEQHGSVERLVHATIMAG